MIARAEEDGRLARDEGLFAGTSSGANVLAAIQVGERLGPDATVATLMVYSGMKYLSTDMYKQYGDDHLFPSPCVPLPEGEGRNRSKQGEREDAS